MLSFSHHEYKKMRSWNLSSDNFPSILKASIFLITSQKKAGGASTSFFLISCLSKPEYDSMTAFWIFPFNVLIRTADPAAAAFMAAFITDLHPFTFPFIYFRRAENSTEFVRALSHADVMI